MPTLLLVLAWVLALIPALFLALIYRRLPAQVPLHWGVTLQPDWVGPKRTLWVVVVLIALPMALLSFRGPAEGAGYHGPVTPEGFALMRVVVAANLAMIGVAAICLSAGYIRIHSFLLIVLASSALTVFGATQLA